MSNIALLDALSLLDDGDVSVSNNNSGGITINILDNHGEINIGGKLSHHNSTPTDSYQEEYYCDNELGYTDEYCSTLCCHCQSNGATYTRGLGFGRWVLTFTPFIGFLFDKPYYLVQDEVEELEEPKKIEYVTNVEVIEPKSLPLPKSRNDEDEIGYQNYIQAQLELRELSIREVNNDSDVQKKFNESIRNRRVS